MNNLIVASGHLGTTLKASTILADSIGGADIFDTSEKPEVDFSKYENFIFGTNIRMFSINKRFKKWAKKLKKHYAGKNVFVFLVGVDIEHRQKYIDKVKKIIPQAIDVIHIWGELNPEGAGGFEKTVIKSVIESTNKEGKEMPHLLTEELKKLSERILNIGSKTIV